MSGKRSRYEPPKCLTLWLPRYYLDDLWFYNLTSGYWTLIAPVSATNPAPRCDTTMILDGRILILFGGFNGSHHFDDTWYFNTTMTSNRWLQKKGVVYPLWPENCTDDLRTVEEDKDECFLLEWKRPVRARCQSPSQEGCRFNDWYAPDPNNSALNFGQYNGAPFYGIINHHDPAPTEPAGENQPIVPEAATGPRQWVRGPQWWNESYPHGLGCLVIMFLQLCAMVTVVQVQANAFLRAAAPMSRGGARPVPRRLVGWRGP